VQWPEPSTLPLDGIRRTEPRGIHQGSFVDNSLGSWSIWCMILPTLISQPLMFQLLQGLGHCHRQKTVHCDVKPSNLCVFTDPSGNIILKLADLGQACVILPSHPPTNFNIQSRAFKAPEVKRKLPYGLKIDIFSAGLVLAYMFLGSPLVKYSLEDDEALEVAWSEYV
jgi:serine/threonine protein kinase